MMSRRRVDPHIAEAMIVGDQDSLQLLGLAKDRGIVCSCQPQLLSPLDLKPQISEQAHCGREHVLIGEEVGHELDSVDFLFLHEGLSVANAGENVLLGDMVVIVADDLLGGEAAGQKPQHHMDRHPSAGDAWLAMTDVGIDFDALGDLHGLTDAIIQKRASQRPGPLPMILPSHQIPDVPQLDGHVPAGGQQPAVQSLKSAIFEH